MAKPVVTVKVDWSLAGSYAAGIDDISGDVKSMTWHRGAPDWAGGSDTGGATIVVNNASGKYNPDNSGGALYGYLLPGRPVHVTAVYSGTTYGIFGGFINRIAIVADTGGRREAEIICVDVFPQWTRRQVYLDASADSIGSVGAIRSTILTKLGAGTPVLPPEEGLTSLPTQGLAFGSALSMLEDLNRAVASRHVIRPRSTPTGSRGWEYLAVSRTNKLSAAVDETLTAVAEFNGYEVSGENVINAPVVTYQGRDTPVGTETVWTHPGPLPIVIPVGTTWTLAPSFDSEWVDLTAYATTTGGTATVTTADCGTQARISIAATVSDVTALAIWVTGRPVASTNAEVTSSNAASITAYGEQSGRIIDSPFLVSATLAGGLADYLLWRYKDPRKRPTLRVSNVFPTVLAREIFDVVGLTLSTFSMTDRRYEIVGLSGTVGSDGWWNVTYALQEMTEQTGSLTTWFLIGTSALGGTHILAH